MADISRTEKLLTELEIKSLLVRERYYRDTKQWENLRKSYHSDASKTNIKITWYHGDIDGFVAGSEKMAQRGSASSAHTICPVEIYLNGNKAVSESTGSILARFVHEDTAFDCVSYGRFVSRLEKEGNEWKILTLEVIYEKDSLQPVTPNGNLKPVSLDPDARASYRCLAWVLAQNEFSIDQDLPGTDKPGSGEALMQSCFKWLHDEAA